MELDDAKQTFIVEAGELLQDMETSLLRLESCPDDADIINALFRAAHTIKGSAGIVGVETVEKFTHFVENLLSKVRDGEAKINSDMIEVLLECRDYIITMVDLSAEGHETLSPEVSARGQKLLDRLSLFSAAPVVKEASKPEAVTQKAELSADDKAMASQTDNWHISLRFGPDVLRNGMDPLSFINYLGSLGEIVFLTTLFDALPSVAEMDPESCYLGFEIVFKSDFDKKTIEDVFEFVREDCTIHILPPHSRVDEYIRLIQELPEDVTRLGEILIKGGLLSQAELEDALQSQYADISSCTLAKPEECKRPIGEILVSEGMVHPEVVDAALEKQKKIVDQKAKESKTIRVDADKLDSLITMVGELVIAGAGMNQHAVRIGDSSLLESASVMSRLVEDIRENAMQVRMVPIGETFSRFQRIVRDISRDSGKEIELVISGGETDLDKTVTEKIGDPLMHLVRNSADHGIEKPADRIAKGKPAKGTISLNAYNDAGSIVIEIVDDGKGLDKKKILAKAIERGMITDSQNLTDREIFALIFEPGFSTADEVTKLSGRGVGMDVVRRNIEALRGIVEMQSKEGEGTTVRIRLPLTLAIIDGFMVGVGEALYVIPLDMVVECIELSETDRRSDDRRHYVNLRGEVLPYIKLSEFFDQPYRESQYQNIVVVQYAGQKIGLVVDELKGEVQTVIKSLGKIYKDIQSISGATILGDGTVALIVDIPKIIQSVEREEVSNIKNLSR